MPDALDPPRTTLLMIDLQEEYLWPDGPMGLPALERAAALLDAARTAGAQVVHVRHISDHPMAEEFRAGSPQVEIRPEVAPREGEPVIDKRAVSAFLGTPLDELLHGDRPRGARAPLPRALRLRRDGGSAVRSAIAPGGSGAGPRHPASARVGGPLERRDHGAAAARLRLSR